MAQEWYLVLTLLVQTYAGPVDQRPLVPQVQSSKVVCEIEARATLDQIKTQIGAEKYTRHVQGYSTYWESTVRLNGTLIGAIIECESRVPKKKRKWIYLKN